MGSIELATCPSESIDEQFAEVMECCARAPIGKRLLGAFYVHSSALLNLDPILQKYEQLAHNHLEQRITPTLIKFNINQPKISYLSYPGFDADAHPALQRSIHVDLKTGEISDRDYRDSDNPFVLHRKETFVAPDYPHYAAFAELCDRDRRIVKRSAQCISMKFYDW
ncbi:MAG: hypothetical protein J0L70_24710 [Leptolyngbya sp. UWPOB_LEPTO1]|uniref:hypothetical protein n=1 Tax=Leptolyngbya sp. UWPOB_LEPTO1 TaxID=2815653 RepID=UPI001AC971BA|nr:hypothetical protein [Leptolyngbya sp. UWPOB_LEPTO1]MBN8563742.1 hypothetical protein [Leptolyngbya sp. UWPOB_LEPTO1]